MKIIQISSYYPPHLGGQENVVQDLSRHLVEAGHDTHVLTSTQGGGRRGLSKEQGVAVFRMNAKEFGHAPIMPAFATRLLSLTSKDSIVHIHVGQAFTPELVWLVSKLRRFPYIAELHIDFEPSGPAGFLLPLYKKFVLRRVLRSAAAVIVLNKKTLQSVRKNYGVPKNRILLMSNGIDESYFLVKRKTQRKQPPKELRLLFVGRMSKQKNLPMLIEAMRLTKQKVHLDIVGDGDQRAVVEKAIADAGLTNVTLHGRLARQEVLNFYAQCDALVMPSLYEAQPLVLLEAMAARIPILGTNVIGVAEHIWGAGIVVEPTAQAFAKGIERLHDEHADLSTFVKAGFDKAEKLRWKNLRKEYESLYQEVLADA